MNKKLLFGLIVPFLMLTIFLSGCTSSAQIVVVGRDSASGTRGAFDELALDKEIPFEGMEQLNSNQAVHDKVATTKNAIGYVGLGYLDDEVKAVTVDGVEVSAATVNDGSYPISRALHMFTSGDPTGLAADFIHFIQSNDGQAIVADEGFVTLDETVDFTANTSLSGTLTVKGSTTVEPIAKAAAEEFEKLYTDVIVEVSGGGSSTGIEAVGEGTVDIGMASRDIKDSEQTEYPDLVDNVVANDGIAVIVHPDNEVDVLTMQEIKDIYLGEITSWNDLK